MAGRGLPRRPGRDPLPRLRRPGRTRQQPLPGRGPDDRAERRDDRLRPAAVPAAAGGRADAVRGGLGPGHRRTARRGAARGGRRRHRVLGPWSTADRAARPDRDHAVPRARDGALVRGRARDHLVPGPRRGDGLDPARDRRGAVERSGRRGRAGRPGPRAGGTGVGRTRSRCPGVASAAVAVRAGPQPGPGRDPVRPGLHGPADRGLRVAVLPAGRRWRRSAPARHLGARRHGHPDRDPRRLHLRHDGPSHEPGLRDALPDRGHLLPGARLSPRLGHRGSALPRPEPPAADRRAARHPAGVRVRAPSADCSIRPARSRRRGMSGWVCS